MSKTKSLLRFLALAFGSSILIGLPPSTSHASDVNFSNLNWGWSDGANLSNAQMLDRTFREVDYSQSGNDLIPWLTFQTYDPSFNLAQVQLQMKSGSQWQDVLDPMTIADFSTANSSATAAPDPRISYTGWMPFLEQCSAYLWCNGLVQYRVLLNDQIFKTFKITYVAKKTNLKVILSSPSELPYGKTFSLKIGLIPKIKAKCSITRNSTSIGTAAIGNGSGLYSMYALTNSKPASAEEFMTLLVDCSGGKYSGAADKIISVFSP